MTRHGTEQQLQQQLQQRLQQAINHLPREQDPARDLWPGIELAINEAPTSIWMRRTALAASIVLVLVSSLYFGSVQRAQTSGSLDPKLILSLQSEHQLSKQALLVEYQAQQPLYPEWETEMQQLEQAEQVIYNALREEPGNIELYKILRQVQQKQLHLIDSVFSPRLTSI